MPAEHPVALTLYSRSGCHLCEDMQAQLAALSAEHGFVLQCIDIDADAALVQRYGSRVPVLMRGETLICEYFLELPALMKALEQA